MSFRFAIRISCVVLAIAGTVTAHAVELVRDINQVSMAASGGGSVVAELPNVTLLGINDGLHGAELWASDGTPEGTRLVRDINPGSASADPNSITVVNGIAYFIADDGTNGAELWRSDGTSAGTSIVANIGPGSLEGISSSRFGVPLPVLHGILYFGADNGVSGAELWRSDGTASGTYRIADIRPGAAGSDPQNLVVAGTRVFFVADDGQHGAELWSTDGTSAGTRLTEDVRPGTSSSQLHSLVASGSTLFFSADDGRTGRELWRAAPGGASAELVKDMNDLPNFVIPGTTQDANPDGFIPVNGGLVFSAFDAVGGSRLFGLFHVSSTSNNPTLLTELESASTINSVAEFGGRALFNVTLSGGFTTELFTTDGTVPGTGPLVPGSGLTLSSGLGITSDGNQAYFFAHAGMPGSPVNIWRSDGSPAGTAMFVALAQPTLAAEIVAQNGRVYFPAGGSTDPAGQELWVSDGTPAGTERLADISPGPAGSMPGSLRASRGMIYFHANDGVVGAEPWVTDGTTAGTVPLGDFNRFDQSEGSDPRPLLQINGGLLFSADDGISGRELWFTDGTTGNAAMVADIFPGDGSSNPRGMVSLGGIALFQADDGVSGRELWRTDGTAGGTFRVLDINPGPGLSDAMAPEIGALVLDGYVYFVADDGSTGREIWRSDGTAAGTSQVADLITGQDMGSIAMFAVLNGRIVFLLGINGPSRLWASDGTVAGTNILHNDAEPIGRDGAIFQGDLYFAGRDNSGRTELWHTDGTPAGTDKAIDMSAQGSTAVALLAATQSTLLFNNCVQGAGCVMYGTDGTVAGTRRLLDLEMRNPIVTDGARAYFAAVVGNTLKLYVTDGTVAGTRPLITEPTEFDGHFIEAAIFAGQLLFSAEDSAIGTAIWRTDLSGGNTELFADIDPGVEEFGDSPQFTAVGDKLFLTTRHVSIGNELWVIDGQRPHAVDDLVPGQYGQSTNIDVLENDIDLDGSIDPGTVEIISSPDFGSAAILPGGQIRYTPDNGFFGADVIRYRFRDDQGFLSNAAIVLITVAAPGGQGPGTGPPPPPPPPPGGSAGGGGGGGALGSELLLLGLLLLRRRRTSRRLFA